MIYFDNNATTEIAPEAAAAMERWLKGSFGNPSSAHDAGTEARRAVADAREAVAGLLGASSADEIVFTSGGTESDNWALAGAVEAQPPRRHIITTAVENEAVSRMADRLERQGCRVTRLGVDREGMLDLEELRSELSGDTAVVSVMLANNETGVLFPVDEIAKIVKANSPALMHVDGVNAAGKVRIDLSEGKIDLFSISAHKFHGPKGVGALYVRNGVKIPSMLIGGGQESGRRAGTEAVHQIAGLGAAAVVAADLSPMERIAEMRDRLESFVLSNIPDTYLNGTADTARRLPNTSNISFANTNGEMILSRLNDLNICVSTGSACHASSHIASPVLAAMDVPYIQAMGSIRFSLGRSNTAEEVERVVTVLPQVISDLRRIAA